MKKFFLLKLIVLTLFLTALISCGKKKQDDFSQIPEMETKKGNHIWYYFSNSGFSEIDKPQNAPLRPQTPWTETIRISSAANATEDQNGNTLGYAVVNRLGIICFEGNQKYLSQDSNVFDNRTAGNLVFLNNTPIFSVYKSAFFNNTISDVQYKNDGANHLFLIQFDSKAKISYPLVNTTNLVDNKNSEVTDFVWDGINWLCSIKTINDTKTEFSYLSWKPNVPLLSLSPSQAKDKITIQPSNMEEFKSAKILLDYKNAPERIKALCKGFFDEVPFSLEIKNADGTSPRIYKNEILNSTKEELNAKAIIAPSWSCVLFEDGTLFLEGALPGKHILREGKPIAIRLPKLPAGFVYSDIVISNLTLYAAWEETSFYKTGRSGFLQVDLEKSLYSKIKF